MPESAMIVVVVVADIFGCVAVLFVAVRSPWPQRLHWLIATNALGSWGPYAAPVIMCEVFVVDVWTEGCRLNVVARTPGLPPRDTTLMLTESAPLVRSALAARWRAAGTPLLLVSDGSGSVSLHGPTNALCGLRQDDARHPTASPVPHRREPGSD